MSQLLKGIHLKLDIETHYKLEKIQAAESEKFNYLTSRRKEDLCVDLVKLGIKEFIKVHELDI